MVVLSVVALVNDSASEMITPLLPVFLAASLGAGPTVVGLVEGLAEAASSLLKLVSGWLADRGWRPKLLVLGGYGVSNLARPLIGLAWGWGWVLAMRVLDRLGKGLRTSPRDALIAGAVPMQQRGRAFGFHRSLDHLGAMVGPLLAFGLLAAGADLALVFALSLIPGVLVLGLVAFGVEEHAPAAPVAAPRLAWRELDPRLRALVLASGGLALGHVPEAFLVLWAAQSGLEPLWLPLLWAATSAAKSGVAMLTGGLSDRIGRLPVVVASWLARIAVLLAVALAPPSLPLVLALFALYGMALAAAEGPERALIGDAAPAERRGTLFGLYHLTGSLAALPGALLFGLLWETVSQTVAFVTAASVTALSATALLAMTARAGGGEAQRSE